MDLEKFHSQVLKDIDHYFKRSGSGNVLKCEKRQTKVENKMVNSFNMLIALSKRDMIQINGFDDEYRFTVLIDGNDVYTTHKCNYRDESFRDSIKNSEKYINIINSFESIGKIFKKKRK